MDHRLTVNEHPHTPVDVDSAARWAAAFRDGLYLGYVDGRPRIGGLELRYLLTTLLLEAGARMKLNALVDAVAHEGFVLRGRPSKVVSDALRWEIGRGRVVRHGRGIYAPGTMPRQTKSRIRRRVRLLRDHVATS